MPTEIRKYGHFLICLTCDNYREIADPETESFQEFPCARCGSEDYRYTENLTYNEVEASFAGHNKALSLHFHKALSSTFQPSYIRSDQSYAEKSEAEKLRDKYISLMEAGKGTWETTKDTSTALSQSNRNRTGVKERMLDFLYGMKKTF